MRHIVTIALLSVGLSASVACSQGPDDEVATVSSAQQADPPYTTTSACTACGCSLTNGGLACYCGPRGPSPEKSECLKNGGPTKAPPKAPSRAVGWGAATVPTAELSAAP